MTNKNRATGRTTIMLLELITECLSWKKKCLVVTKGGQGVQWCKSHLINILSYDESLIVDFKSKHVELINGSSITFISDSEYDQENNPTTSGVEYDKVFFDHTVE